MNCAACSSRVEKAVSKLDGVSSCYVNLLTGDMGVEGTATENEIISAVEKAGYGAALNSGSKNEKKDTKSAPRDDILKSDTSALFKRFIVSLALLLPLMYISMGHVMWGFPLPSFLEGNPASIGLTELLICAAVMIINGKFFVNGIKGLLHGAPNMDTLVAIGSGASFIYSTWALYAISEAILEGNLDGASHYMHELYFEGAAMILTLITLGKTLESYSKGKTTNAIRALMELSPDSAYVIRDGKEIKIPASELEVDDEFVVYPGEKIPCDGIIINGSCAVDESALTGESMPVDKKEGDKVSTATVTKSGFIRCRATAVGEDTSLFEIIRMVSDASSEKAPVAKAADKVSGIFVPAVMVISLVTTVIWLLLGESVGFALARGISVLVISCPCALGLATPVAIMVGSGIGAKNGILFKTAEALEETGKVKTVVLDKTGTLTKGEPKVTDVICFGYKKDELLTFAASVEKKSEHPLGRAVVLFAEENGLSMKESENFSITVGSGVSAEIEGESVFGGNYDFISKKATIPTEAEETAKKLSDEGKTPLFFAKGKDLMGIIAVSDVLREDSIKAVERLHSLGLKVIMLTGDNERTAEAIGRAAGVDRIIGGVLPGGKEKVIKELKAEGKVAMVGDGINDAPALTAADTGIAIGAGTDVAIDAADVVLMGSSVYDVSKAIKLSRRTLTNIHENLFWAFFYNAIGIPVAAGVLIKALGISLSPMLAVAAMSLSSFFVVTNALRLNLFGNKLKGDVYKNESADNKSFEVKVTELPAFKSETIQKENIKMEKTMNIEGMMCPHCEARVKKCLEALDGVTEAVVSHESGTAVVTLSADVSDEILKETVERQGYTVL